MRKLLIFLFVSLSVILSAQPTVYSTFNGYADLQITGAGPTYNFSISNFNGTSRNQVDGPWQAYDIAVGDVVWADCARFIVTNVVTSSFATAMLEVQIPAQDVLYGFTIPIGTTTRCAIVREIAGGSFFAQPPPADGNNGALSGVDNSLYACMSAHYATYSLTTYNTINEIWDYTGTTGVAPAVPASSYPGQLWKNSVGEVFYSDGVSWLSSGSEVKLTNVSQQGLPSGIYKLAVDTLGIDTMYVANNGIFRRFQAGGSTIDSVNVITSTNGISVKVNTLQSTFKKLPVEGLAQSGAGPGYVPVWSGFGWVTVPLIFAANDTGTSVLTSNTLSFYSSATINPYAAGLNGKMRFLVRNNSLDSTHVRDFSIRLRELNPVGGTANQLIRVNSGGTALEYFTPTYISSAITSLNGLTGATQTFSVGTTGTNFNISSVGTNHQFNIPIASGTNTGLLSNTDWTTFNNKPSGTGVNGQVTFWTGTSTQSGNANFLYDYTNGKVGIGTSSPGARLTILDNNMSGNYVFEVRADDQNPYLAGFYNNTYSTTIPAAEYFAFNNGDFRMGTPAAKPFALYTNGYTNPRIHIAATGQVGVGTTSSNAQLITVGQGSTSGTWTAQFHNSTGSNSALMIRDDGNIGIGTAANNPKLDIVTGIGNGTINESNCLRLRHSTTNGNTFVLQLGVSNVGAGGQNQGYGYIQTGLWGGSTDNPFFFAPKGGKVGIGLDPSANRASWPLTVGSDIISRAATNTGNATISKIGFAAQGISSTTPAYMAGIFDKSFWFQGAGLAFYTVAGADISNTNGVERLRINSNGLVGIGTSTPLTTLQVKGQVTVDTLTATANRLGGWSSGNIATAVTLGTNLSLSGNVLNATGGITLDSLFFRADSLGGFVKLNTTQSAKTLIHYTALDRGVAQSGALMFFDATKNRWNPANNGLHWSNSNRGFGIGTTTPTQFTGFTGTTAPFINIVGASNSRPQVHLDNGSTQSMFGLANSIAYWASRGSARLFFNSTAASGGTFQINNSNAGGFTSFYIGSDNKTLIGDNGTLVAGSTRFGVVGAGNTNTTWTAQFHNSTGTNLGFGIMDDGTLQASAYANTVNTTGLPVNVLTTSSTGVVQSHPISEVFTTAMREETFTATASQTSFTIAYSAPAVSGTSVPVRVYRNGIRLNYVASGPNNYQFTYSGTTITTSACIAGDLITVEYLN